jgi:hypothetical protein
VKGQEDNIDIYYNSREYFQKLETSLAEIVGLPELRSGWHVIRNEKEWRENEKYVAYIWVVQISRSFLGWGGLFSIKFNESKFRKYLNKDELVQGVFICNRSGIEQVYTKTLPGTTKDIIGFFKCNLFEAAHGMTLDGVSYNLKVSAPSIDTFISLNNPNTSDWKKWEHEVWALGKELAKESGSPELIGLFG